MKKTIALLVAEFFYCGRFKKAPGTMGSLGALAIWVPALLFGAPTWLLGALLLALFGIGWWASAYGIEHYQNPDPKQVVIDEVVGVGLPFLIIGPTFLEIAAAFLLFRLFDIWKPGPIGQSERYFKGALGIMVDDVVAGIFATVVIAIFKVLWA